MPENQFTPTDEQLAIRDAVRTGGDSLLIEAGAGCAKSTTLEWIAPDIKGPAGAIAFNKATAEGLARRLPGNFLVKTFNALGYGALSRGPLRGKSTKVDPGKVGKIVTKVLKEQGGNYPEETWGLLRSMVGLAQQRLLSPNGAEGEWGDVAADAGVSEEDIPQHVDLAWECLRQNNEATHQGLISFDDQIYGSLMFGGVFTQVPTLMVDEDQDLSASNIEMIKRMKVQRLLAVGDRRQAIYAFRGAHGDAAGQLNGLMGGQMAELPLMMTFRCPKAVVARQQRHAPGYRCGPGAAEGRVWELDRQDEPENPENEWLWGQVIAAAGGHPVAVLCRNNSPVISLAFRLLRSGTGVKMLKGDIGKQLEGLLRRLAPDPSATAVSAAGAITDWMEHECDLALANRKPERVAGIRDRGESLLAVIEGCRARTVADISAGLKSLFARTDGQITLGSIHSAKGLEWDTVLHLDPWRVPSRQAKRAAQAGDMGPMRQEWNLRYVAETRVRRNLLLGSVDGLRGI